MKYLFSAFFLFIFSSSSFGSGQAVVQSRSSHPLEPTRSDVNYEIECPKHKYLISIDYHRKKISFRVDGHEIENELFKSNSMASLISSKELFGRFGFSCSEKGLSLTFVGFDINSDPVRPIEYTGVISNTGDVLVYSGIQSTNLQFIQQLWSVRSH